MVDLSIAPPGTPAVVNDLDDDPLFAEDLTPGVAVAGGDPLAAMAPEVTEQQCRDLLAMVGSAASMLGADEDLPEQWEFTDAELDELAPILTRIANRHLWMRRLIAKGDGIFLAFGFARYLKRNVQDGQAARAAREGNTDGLLDREGGAAAPARPQRAREAAAVPWGLSPGAGDTAGIGSGGLEGR
jgi:hypothetical protein